MDDVNEWSTEYNVKVESFSDLSESPHSWDKKVLNISPIKVEIIIDSDLVYKCSE